MIKKHYWLPSLKNKWQQLENSHIPPFMHYEYVYRMWRDYFLYCIQGRLYPVFFEVTNEDGKTVLIAPLVKNINNSSYSVFGNVNGCSNTSFIYSNNDEAKWAINQLIEYLSPSYIILSRVKDSSGFALLSNSINGYELIGKTSCVDISFAESFKDWFSNLSKSQRQNIRTSYNRCLKDGLLIDFRIIKKNRIQSVEFTMPFDESNEPAEINGDFIGCSRRSLFNKMMSLYFVRHEKRYGVKTNIFKRFYLRYINFSSTNTFYDESATSFLLFMNGSLVAFMSGFSNEDGNQFIVPRLSIDGHYSYYSPGVVLICETIRYLSSKTSIRVLDLSQGVESYKLRMGGKQYNNLCFKLHDL